MGYGTQETVNAYLTLSLLLVLKKSCKTKKKHKDNIQDKDSMNLYKLN